MPTWHVAIKNTRYFQRDMAPWHGSTFLDLHGNLYSAELNSWLCMPLPCASRHHIIVSHHAVHAVVPFELLGCGNLARKTVAVDVNYSAIRKRSRVCDRTRRLSPLAENPTLPSPTTTHPPVSCPGMRHHILCLSTRKKCTRTLLPCWLQPRILLAFRKTILYTMLDANTRMRAATSKTTSRATTTLLRVEGVFMIVRNPEACNRFSTRLLEPG